MQKVVDRLQAPQQQQPMASREDEDPSHVMPGIAPPQCAGRCSRTRLGPIVALAACLGGDGGRGAVASPSMKDPPARSKDALEIVYDIDLDAAVDERASGLRREIETKLAENKIEASVTLPAISLGAITIAPRDRRRQSEVTGLVQSEYRDMLAPRTCESDTPTNAICFHLSPSHADGVRTAALKNAVAMIRARLDTLQIAPTAAIARHDTIVVELPTGNSEAIETARWLISRPCRLEWQVVVDGSDYMSRLFKHVGRVGRHGTPSDEQAGKLAIKAEVDEWRETGGAAHVDYYLHASDRDESVPVAWAKRHGCLDRSSVIEGGRTRCKVSGRQTLERYLFGHPGENGLLNTNATFRIPDDRQIAFESYGREGGRDELSWRTYYLEREVSLSSAMLSNAVASYAPDRRAAIIVLEFNPRGAKLLADLTTRSIGKKVAHILDGRVMTTPVVLGAIKGGRTELRMAGGSAQAQQEARHLAICLKAGPLPSPLRERSAHLIKR